MNYKCFNIKDLCFYGLIFIVFLSQKDYTTLVVKFMASVMGGFESF